MANGYGWAQLHFREPREDAIAPVQKRDVGEPGLGSASRYGRGKRQRERGEELRQQDSVIGQMYGIRDREESSQVYDKCVGAYEPVPLW